MVCFCGAFVVCLWCFCEGLLWLLHMASTTRSPTHASPKLLVLQVPGMPAAQEVSMSGFFAAAVGCNNKLHVWGCNEHTVLGLGAHGAPPVVREPVAIPGLYAEQVCLHVAKGHAGNDRICACC